MHASAMARMEWFVNNYVKNEGTVLDVGSYDVNGCFRGLFDCKKVNYIGLDIEMGPNVDIVPQNPYVWNEIENESCDWVISGCAFEHIEYPWLTMQEIYKKLKNGGVACIIAPNFCNEHKYPKDCWRFFSDGLIALAKYAGLQVINATVAGVPDLNVEKRWDDRINDASIIAVKSSETVNVDNYKKLEFERRISPDVYYKSRWEFISQWMSIENRQKLIKSFIGDNVETVFVYGYGLIGKEIYKEVRNIPNVMVYVMDKRASDITEIDAVMTGNKVNEKNAIMLISVLEENDEIMNYLNKIYGMPKFYVSEIFMDKC